MSSRRNIKFTVKFIEIFKKIKKKVKINQSWTNKFFEKIFQSFRIRNKFCQNLASDRHISCSCFNITPGYGTKPCRYLYEQRRAVGRFALARLRTIVGLCCTALPRVGVFDRMALMRRAPKALTDRAPSGATIINRASTHSIPSENI